MYELVINNARIVDGTGSPWRYGSVAVTEGRIAEISHAPLSGKRIIDAAGRVIAPGFIDSHSHSDSSLLLNPLAESKIRQGVTTEVIGQCGSSASPLTGAAQEEARAMLDRYGISHRWQRLGEYLSVLEELGIAVNVVALAGHGTIRAGVMGYDDRPPTEDELAEMKRLVAEAMEDGAFGLTTGLIYPPGSYALTPEIVELARVVAERGGIYMTHMRDEGDRLMDSVEEALAVGAQAGIPVQISHHKAVDPDNWGKVRQSLARLEEARTQGIDVTCDQYPYIATATGLSSILPGWAHEGGVNQLRARLCDPATRSRLATEVNARQLHKGGWDRIFVSHFSGKNRANYQGKNIATIAREQGRPEVEVAFDILLEAEGSQVGMVRFGMCEEDVVTVLRHPLVMVGSDASAVAPYGPLGEGRPHPRGYGTFPRILGKYVREERVLTLEEAVYKMTALPAARFGLYDRGQLFPGFRADLVVFDAETISDRATFENPHQYPSGIDLVVVNGVVTVEEGQHTGARAGRALRKNRG